MKKIMLLLLCSWASLAQKNIVVQGFIKNPQSPNVRFNVVEDLLVEKGFDVNVDERGFFKFSYPSNQMVRIDFAHGDPNPNQPWYEAPIFYAWVFEPQDSINVSFDAQNFWNTLAISGKNEAKFRYYVEDFKVCDIENKWRDVVEKNVQLPIVQQFAYLDSIRNVKNTLFEKHQSGLTPFFKEFQRYEILAMINLNQVVSIEEQRAKNLSFVLQPAIGSFVFDGIEQNDINAQSGAYVDYVEKLLWLKFQNTSMFSGMPNDSNYDDFKEKYLTGKMKEVVLARQVFNLFQVFNEYKDKAYQEFGHKKYLNFLQLYPESKFMPILSKVSSGK